MIISDHPQGSPWWQAERLGKLTASEFDRILTPKRLDLSGQLDAYLDRLVAEYLIGAPIEPWQGSFWTERGQSFEAHARLAFQVATGLTVQQVGFATSERPELHGLVGCSVDGLVYDGETCVGWLELKCPAPHTHMGYWRTRMDAMPYLLQRNGQAFVTELTRGFFQSYCPGLPECIVEYGPSERVQEALETHLATAAQRLLDYRAEVVELGCEPQDPADWAAEQEAGEWAA